VVTAWVRPQLQHECLTLLHPMHQGRAYNSLKPKLLYSPLVCKKPAQFADCALPVALAGLSTLDSTGSNSNPDRRQVCPQHNDRWVDPTEKDGTPRRAPPKAGKSVHQG
jgi:hypothetical protein